MTLQRIRDRFDQRLNRTPLPRDLDEIIRIDPAEVSPEQVGLSQRALDAIWNDTLNLYRSGMHPMLSLCVRRNGELLINRSIGYQRGDAASEDAVIGDLNTPICLFSASKAISAMLVHLLAEQGKIHLMDPLSYYIPEFAANGKGYITIYRSRGIFLAVSEPACRVWARTWSRNCCLTMTPRSSAFARPTP